MSFFVILMHMARSFSLRGVLWLALICFLLVTVFGQIHVLASLGFLSSREGYSLSEGSEGFGTNTWRAQFDAGYALFNKRYRPTPANGVPVYAPQISVTGLFVNDEPATQKTM